MYCRIAPILIFISLSYSAAQPVTDCSQVLQLKKLLDVHHVNPLPWDDSFGEKVTDQLFSLIDPQAIFFNLDEKQLIKINAHKLDNELSEGNCSIVKDLMPLYKNSLTRAERFITELSKAPLDFGLKDTLHYNFENSPFLSTDAMLRKRWLQLTKFSVLKELYTPEEDARSITQKYKPVADKVYKKYLNVIKRRREIAGGLEKYMVEKLLNAIAKSYDPHTEFYPSHEKQSFLDILSSDHYSFGFMLEDDPLGNVIIGRIIPGSSAWDGRNIHVGDVVTAISSPHIEKIDATLYTHDELDEVLASISKEVEISLRKVNGEQLTVKLFKQKVREDDNKIKSLILSNATNRFGYVSLPIFFTKNEITKTGCATELAKEIIQLKKANIQGLILDIRNNGGGDLDEALDLAGIFIDRGALAILKGRGEPETLKDNNLGTVYDGPLLVMINGASASASELFAAVMRDHRRGILVGNTTYGKGTGQSVLFFSPSREEMIKITTFRFYSVKGTSHQGEGIPADIPLPEVLSELEYREATQQHVLKADAVQKKTYYTPLAPLPIDLLRDSSAQRIIKNPFFINLQKRKQQLKPYWHGREFNVPLSIAGFSEMNRLMRTDKVHLKPVLDKYTIKLTNFDQQINGVDSFGRETFTNLIDDVSEDFYIDEALRILLNYIQIKK